VRDRLQLADGTIRTFSLLTSGGSIDITAKSIRLLENSNIVTSVLTGIGNGGDITLRANSIVALGDSNILAFARDGRGGNITLNTRAFFGQNYRPAPLGTDPLTLIGNGRVDVNASGSVAGVITVPDSTFIQNSLTQLPQGVIDTTTLLASSCIVRRNQSTGNFFITGSGGLPEKPGEVQPAFPTGEVRSLGDGEDRGDGGVAISSLSTPSTSPWKIGDPIVEPQGVYQLPNGELVLSHECP
jgi:large exoprotein involved in heme utilization and adhesion